MGGIDSGVLLSKWRALGKAGKWIVVITVLVLMSMVVRGLESVGVIDKQKPLTTTAPERAPQAAAAPVEPSAPTVASDDARLRLPIALDGFTLVEVGYPSMPKHDQSTSARAKFLSADGKRDIVVVVARDGQSLDEMGLKNPKTIQVGEGDGRQTVDVEVKNTATLWKRGEFLFSLFHHSEPFDAAEALDESKKAATTIEAHAATVDKLSDDERAKRVDSLESSVDVGRARAELVERFAKSLPEWATSAKPTPYSKNGVTVTVATIWLAVNPKIRETQARQLWQKWASIAAPQDVDSAHLTLVDASGKKVGGSGVMGSSISLE